MPIYEHQCKKCNHEWEDEYKMVDPIPDTCPKCKETGCVKRLISLQAPGKVELYGMELTSKLWADGKKMAKNAMKDDNLMHDICGETANPLKVKT